MQIVWEVVDIQIQLGNCALWVERSFRKHYKPQIQDVFELWVEKSHRSTSEISNPDYLGMKWWVMGWNNLGVQQKSQTRNGDLWGRITSVFNRNLKSKVLWVVTLMISKNLGFLHLRIRFWMCSKQERDLCLDLQSQKCDRTRLKHTPPNIFSGIMSIFTDSNKFCSF